MNTQATLTGTLISDPQLATAHEELMVRPCCVDMVASQPLSVSKVILLPFRPKSKSFGKQATLGGRALPVPTATKLTPKSAPCVNDRSRYGKRKQRLSPLLSHESAWGGTMDGVGDDK